MKKNVSGQVVVAQLIAKADGTPITSGTTTCYVLGDGGTQAAGSVSSGACTHEGNGVWSYAPAQAETNYDHVAFTFVNTNAVNATVQVYTSYPQTGDNYARLGAPAGASVSADVAAIKSDTGGIKTKTDSLTFTVAGMVDSNVVDWKGSTAPAMTGDAYARLGVPAGASVSADIAAIPTATQNADALLKRDWTAVTGEAARSVLNALRFLRNKWSLSGGTLTVTKEDDSTSAWTAATTTNAGADPVTSVDPT